MKELIILQRPPYPPPISTIESNDVPNLLIISDVFLMYLIVVGDIFPIDGYS